MKTNAPATTDTNPECTPAQREQCPLMGRCPACQPKDVPHWGEGMASIIARLPWAC